jgi:hypothetical protein
VDEGGLLAQREVKLRVFGQRLRHLSLTYRFEEAGVKRQRRAKSVPKERCWCKNG